jgi:hypothetical protein
MSKLLNIFLIDICYKYRKNIIDYFIFPTNVILIDIYRQINQLKYKVMGCGCKNKQQAQQPQTQTQTQQGTNTAQTNVQESVKKIVNKYYRR